MNFNQEINDNNHIKGINAYEGVIILLKAKEIRELWDANSISKNITNYEYEYDMPYKERYKVVIQENVDTSKDYFHSLLFSIFWIKSMMDFMTSSEDKDMYYKKTYDDASKYVPHVEYTSLKELVP